MKVLVTGGAGFIVSHFINQLLATQNTELVVNLDAWTYAGNLANLTSIEHDDRYHLVVGTINDEQLVDRLVQQYHLDVIVNFAAESHVDRSIQSPDPFVATNVMGTQALLNVAVHRKLRFIQVSTDEVYGSVPIPTLTTEAGMLNPSSPYAASKAAADMLVLAAVKTFGLDACITRCCNNFGPNQYPEKLVPLMTIKLLLSQPLPVFGDGSDVRDWLSVSDHCHALELVMRKGQAGEIYHISDQHPLSNLAIIRLIAEQLRVEPMIRQLPDRPGHDQRYALDSQKIRTTLGWQPKSEFTTAFHQTVTWYQHHQDWWQSKLSDLPYYSLK